MLKHTATCSARSSLYRHAPVVRWRQQMRLRSTETSTTDASTSTSQIPPGCSRYTVELKKPLGIVLEQAQNGNIYVASITPDGNAAKAGVGERDQLIATSGVVYNTVNDYGGVSVKGGQQLVRMTVQGEPFKAVSAAIGSHPGHIAVTLEFQRCSKD